jgi:anti-sigma B factor antagonist
VAPLTLDRRQEGEAAVIALAGELDLAGAATLEQALGAIDAPALVVDLRGLEFMDSSGLRAIVVSAQRAQDAGRRFALIPGAAQVMRVFDITRMRERFEFVADAREVSGRP